VALVTVASYNTHWGRDMRGRPFDVVEVCRRLDCDVVVLQESWRPHGGEGDADRAARLLGYTVEHLELGQGYVERRPRLAHRPGPAQGSWGVSVLCRLPETSFAAVELGSLPMDQAPRRAAVRLDAVVAGRAFTVFGTHLSHLSHGSPLLVRRLARHLPGPDHPTAVAGDMNMWGPVITALLPGWRRAVVGRTWPARMAHSQIDHVMVNPAVQVVGSSVPRAGRSDHRPVMAVLRV